MSNVINFSTEFGMYKESDCKNFDKINLSIHPTFNGIFYCFLELYKGLQANISQVIQNQKLIVWKDKDTTGYLIANSMHWYLCFSKNPPADVTLLVYPYPKSHNKIEQLKQISSDEFIHFISSFRFDINQINPIKLQRLINAHISFQTILKLNKEKSQKPHSQMSLELLAQLLQCSRNQLNQRIKKINQQRTHVLNELSLNSSCVKELIDHPNTSLNTEKIWRS
ncbi:hypothetical protein P256_01534 [Acinetobacter nectaris CIP 110549]|uniref:Uncharacterized protein n=1 Tax=Acinetobacter nectaris CIP 110549 TaxID=1392540 RepID=V2TRN3_9GAMM|nr:hypothetical protein [Acinetobacter nectaris]ESK38715.1 hypothetical protein P256_01534 [Acinetobacter nectaris CIP 110549]